MTLPLNPDKPILIYNTLNRKREPFVPLRPGKVAMYNCGPTVYDYFHVGNARNFVCADVIRRYLAWRGYEVTFAQNITDVDDKIIKRANEEGRSAEEVAEQFTQVFFESTEKLDVRKADHHPCATKYIGKMIGMVRKLEKAGYAYAVEGDVFFRVSKFEEYGKLSGRKVEDLMSGARVEVSTKKENPADFSLWKPAKEGEPFWKSPWGDGRPGWHLECSVMAMDILGETLDIHMGGNDLIFPHHENEIAQSEALTGKPFARYWLHNGFLNVDGEKMSKSLGNFFTIDEVLAKFPAPVVRYFLLGAHYRAPLDFSDTALTEATTALDRLREARKTARRLLGTGETPDATDNTTTPLPENIQPIYETFQNAMDDDFNTPRALAALFESATRINQLGNKAIEAEKTGAGLGQTDLGLVAALARALDELGGDLLGIVLESPHADLEPLLDSLKTLFLEIGKESHGLGGQIDQCLSSAPAEDADEAAGADHWIERLVALRAATRKEKQWALADRIRDELKKMNLELLDRPGATEWKKTT